jgi:hypothetical protein
MTYAFVQVKKQDEILTGFFIEVETNRKIPVKGILFQTTTEPLLSTKNIAIIDAIPLRAFLWRMLHASNPLFDRILGLSYPEAVKQEFPGQDWIGDISHGGGGFQLEYRVSLMLYSWGYIPDSIDGSIFEDPNFKDIDNRNEIININYEIGRIKRDFEKFSKTKELEYTISDYENWQKSR